MLFDLYDYDPKNYSYWIKRVHFVATTLGYDYFKLWDLNELEFKILEDLAYEELENRKEKIEKVKQSNNK